MEISRGIIIATGFSLILLAIAMIGIFFFLKRKYFAIETKINILFKLVQDEAIKNQQQNNIVYRENTDVTQAVQRENTDIEHEKTNNLINVSDDESLLDEDNSDIESTDSEDSDDHENKERNDIDDGADIIINENVKKVELQDIQDIVNNGDSNDNDNDKNILSIKINKLKNDVEDENQNEDENEHDAEDEDDEDEEEEEKNETQSNKSYHSVEDTDETRIKKNIQYLTSNNYKKMNVSTLRDTIQYLDLPIMGNIKQTKKKELLDMIDMYINKNTIDKPNKTFNVNDLFNKTKNSTNEENNGVELNIENGADHVDEDEDEDNKDNEHDIEKNDVLISGPGKSKIVDDDDELHDNKEIDIEVQDGIKDVNNNDIKNVSVIQGSENISLHGEIDEIDESEDDSDMDLELGDIIDE
jgi:hypothetical protein